MLRFRSPGGSLADAIGRRDFLRLGSLGGLGLALPGLLRASARQSGQRSGGFGRARRCILLFLTGGAPHTDTFDPKPLAAAEYRGDLQAIATAVPGMAFGELFPRMARQAAKLCVVRSVTHGDRVHTSAGYTMLTGARHPQADGRSAKDIKTSPHDHPALGSLLALAQPSPSGLPVCASLPETIKDAGINVYPGQDGGLLGKRLAPWRIEADETHTGFRTPDIVLPEQLTVERLAERRLLLSPLERATVAGEAAADMDQWQRQAFALLRTPALRQAFLLDQEPERTRDDYGRHLFGQGCLLARRLLEAGIRLVTVYWHYEGPDDSPVWDTHQNNFRHLRERLAPPTDRAVAALVGDLSQRGLLDETLVICMGEFGRSPRVNRYAGRDHWPNVQSVVLAGAGIPGGSIHGSSDRIGAFPGTNPVSPADLTATVLHLLGVPADLDIHDRTNRPYRACTGTPIRELCM